MKKTTMTAKKEVSSIKKLIDLPSTTVSTLDTLAEVNRMKTKPFMELVLIKFAQNHKTKNK